MKKIFIVANWKSNKTEFEAKNWLQEFKIQDLRFTNKDIIICPSFTLLFILKSYILNHKSPTKLGVQDISPFPEGSYTGEINGKQIKELAEYVIIGHSERREYFKEDEEMINKKIEQAVNNGLTPIVCISNQSQISNLKSQIQNLKLKTSGLQIIIAYEPLFAIGSGQADTPEGANEMSSLIKKELGEVPVLYGGSVTSENINSFTRMEYIDGVLVGKASLNFSEFLKIAQNA